MNIVDVMIVLLLIAGGVFGLKRGFTKSLVCCIGMIAVVVLAFLLKNPVSVFFYENLPFFKFGGVFKGVTVLNILIYEVIAFLLVFAILQIGLRILMLATTIFEKILNVTVILSIPSKLLGMLVGIVEYFIIVFIGLYVLSLPIFHFDFIEESKYRVPILESTPVLSGFLDTTNKVIKEFAGIKEKYETTPDSNQFNYETLDLFLKYKVIDVKSVEKLMEKDKLKLLGVETLLEKYKGEKYDN